MKREVYALVDVESESLREARHAIGNLVYGSEMVPALDGIYDAMAECEEAIWSYDYVGPSDDCRPEADVTINSECEIV